MPRKDATRHPPTLAQLRLFVAVADEGSFSGAAAALGMSQSSLSEGVRALEVALGQTLFERARQGAALTVAGGRALGYARDALIAVQDLQLAANPAQALSGELSVATYRSLGQQLLAPALADLHQAHPQLHVRILDAARDGQGGLALVRRGEADVGLIEQPPAALRREQKAAGVLFEPLLRDPYRVVTPAHAPLTLPLTWAAIAGQPLILPLTYGAVGLSSDNGVRDLLRVHQALSSNITEVAEDDVILSMVRYGLGLTIFPELALGNLPPELISAPLPQPLERVVGLAVRAGRSQLPHVRALQSAVRAALREREAAARL